MAEQADALEREDDPIQPELEGDAPETPEPDDDDPPDPEGDDLDDGGDTENQADEFEISFGDEAAPASRGSDSDLVKHLRQEIRARDDKLAKIERGEIPAQPQKIEVGDKPTLEACEFDEAKFESELIAWQGRKAKADEADRQVQAQVTANQERFAKKLEAFAVGRTALKAPDFEAAEMTVLNGLSQVQTAIVIKAADDSAKLIYALGRHPQKLAAISAIEDPIEFAAAVVKLEGTLKVTQRSKTPPEPDRPLRGGAPIANRTDKERERLEKEAERTNDRSKLIAYNRKLRAQGRT